MITVNFTYENKEIKKVSVSGHSLYDKKGSDIVCSSVSTAVIYSIRLLEANEEKFTFREDEKKPEITILVNEVSSLTNLVLDNLKILLEDLSKDYPNNIKIKEALKWLN